MPWNFRIGGAALVSLALSGAVSGDEGSVPLHGPGQRPTPVGRRPRIGTTRFWHGSGAARFCSGRMVAELIYRLLGWPDPHH